MPTLRWPFASLALLCLAQIAVAQSRPIPMDAGGRALKDDRNQRLEYSSPPPVSDLLTPQVTAQPSVQTPPPNRTSQRSRKTAGPSQKTGISPSYDIAWRTASFGTGIGATGIWPVDANGDGDHEVVLGGGILFGGNSFWSIVDFNEAEDRYEILWQSPPYYAYGVWSPAITALRVVELGNTKQVWVGRSDGQVDVVNVLTREIVQTLAPGMGEITDFAIADADNDAATDVVVLTATHIYLYDPATLTLTRTIDHGGDRIAIGNVDDDSRLETVLNTGQVLDIDGASTTVQWNAGARFGVHIELADIDADGRAELLAAEGWYLIRAWDVDAESLKWSFDVDLDIGAFRMIDVAGDTTPEIVYGDGQWGEIHVVDAATQTELWSIPNPEHGTTDVAVIDADGDGELEILWGAGWSSTGPDYLYVHDLLTRAAEWQSHDYLGPYTAVDLGDVDADGRLEIVVASFESQSGYADGLLMVYDASTNALEWMSDGAAFGSFAWTGVHGLKLVNVDADPQLEIAVVTDRLYDGALYVIDGLTHEQQNEAFYDIGSPLSVLDAADLTGDGQAEIVAGNSVAHTGSPGVFIYVLDPLTDEIVWQSAALATGFSSVTDIAVVDVGAAGDDILAVSSAIHAVRWSDRRHLISTTTGYLSVAAGDVDAAAGTEILAGTNSGTIDVLDGETLEVLSSYDVCDAAIPALQMHASNQIVLTCGDTLLVYSLSTQAVVDATPTGIGQLGLNSSLVRAVEGNRSLIVTGGDEAVKFIDLSTNHVPTLSVVSAGVHWRGAVELQMSASDLDNDPLRFELVSLPSLGSATWLDPVQGLLRYAAGGIGTGSDPILVRVSDGAQYSATHSIDMMLLNTVPSASTTTLSFHWRGEQTATLAGTDADNDPLSFALKVLPTRGDAAVNAATGALIFTPTGAFVGSDTLSYTVTDGPGSATVEVEIALTNTAPVAAEARYDITRGTTINGRFRATDANADPVTFSLIDSPTIGTITFEASSGLFEYVPGATGVGIDTVTFAADDGISKTQAKVEFHYAAASPPPSGGGSGSGGGGGGSIGVWLLMLLLPLTVLGRRKPSN